MTITTLMVVDLALLETIITLTTDRPTTTPMMGMITSSTVDTHHTLTAQVVVMVEVQDGLAMRVVKTMTQSATLMKTPVPITTMPTQTNVETTILILSWLLIFAAHAMELVAPLQLPTLMAMELDTATVLAMGEDQDGLVMRVAKTMTQSATLLRTHVPITTMQTQTNVETTILKLSLLLIFAVHAMELEAILQLPTLMEMELDTAQEDITLRCMAMAQDMVMVEVQDGPVMRVAKTMTQSATLLRTPVPITTMPTQTNAETTILILSWLPIFAVHAMELEAILQLPTLTAMEQDTAQEGTATVLATVEVQDGLAMRVVKTMTQSATLLRTPVPITMMPTQINAETMILKLS